MSICKLSHPSTNLEDNSLVLKSIIFPCSKNSIKKIIHYRHNDSEYLLICLLTTMATIQHYCFSSNDLMGNYPFPGIPVSRLKQKLCLSPDLIKVIVNPEQKFIYLINDGIIYAFDILTKMWIIFYKFSDDIYVIHKCANTVDNNGCIVGILFDRELSPYKFKVSTIKKNPEIIMNKINFSHNSNENNWEIMCKAPWINGIHNIYKSMMDNHQIDISKIVSLKNAWNSCSINMEFVSDTFICNLFNQILCFYYIVYGQIIFDCYDLENGILYEHVGLFSFKQNDNNIVHLIDCQHSNLRYCYVVPISRNNCLFTFYECDITSLMPQNMKLHKKNHVKQKVTQMLNYYCRSFGINEEPIKQMLLIFLEFYPVWY